MNQRMKMKVIKPRIELTDHDMQRFSDTILSQSIPTLVKKTGLSYMLIYNIVRRRVKTILEGNSLEIEKIKENIYGGKLDYIRYSEVEEELYFLRKYAKKSAGYTDP